MTAFAKMEAEKMEGKRMYLAVLALVRAAAPNQCSREGREAIHHFSLLQLNNCT